jgi:hypothetical protein
MGLLVEVARPNAVDATDELFRGARGFVTVAGERGMRFVVIAGQRHEFGATFHALCADEDMALAAVALASKRLQERGATDSLWALAVAGDMRAWAEALLAEQSGSEVTA